MICAIGFDIGDTLLFYVDTPLDWSSCYGEALSYVAQACGVFPAAAQLAEAGDILRSYNTRVSPRTKEVTAEHIFSLILRAWASEPGEYLQVAVDSFFTFFQQRMCTFPETLRVLRTLRAAGIRLGALTDVPYGMPMRFVQRDLDRAQLSSLLDTVITSAMVGVRKPEAAGYHILAASLGITPDEMLYVGNEPKDVVGAQRAGVRSVFLDRSQSGGRHGQTFTITSLDTLHEITCAAV
jgi:putative hydrolase of the HAD superfamily